MSTEITKPTKKRITAATAWRDARGLILGTSLSSGAGHVADDHQPAHGFDPAGKLQISDR